jgi:hypothetical protein
LFFLFVNRDAMKLYLLSIVCLVAVTSCNHGVDSDNYKRAVKSGFAKIPEALEIESVFGEAYHSITSSPGAPKDWQTHVFFGGRYELVLDVPIKTNFLFTEITDVTGPPDFHLLEVRNVTISPTQQVETWYSNDWKFGEDDWKKVLSAKGDFSVIGLHLKLDSPVKDFAAYVAGETRGRSKIRPDK